MTVANGRIQEFQDGVLIRSSAANLLTDLTVAVVGGGVHLDQASSTQIVGNDIHSAGTGIFVSQASFNVIRGNEVSDTGTGVFMIRVFLPIPAASTTRYRTTTSSET